MSAPDITTLSFDNLVSWYAQIRDWRDTHKKAFEANDANAKQVQDGIEAEIMKRFNASGMESARAGDMVAYVHRDTRYRCGDWNALHDYIRTTGNFDLLQKRLSSTAMATLLEESQTLPPGVASDTERTIRIRKA